MTTNRIEATCGIARHAPALREIKRALRADAKVARRIERAREGGDDGALAHLCDVQARSYHSRLAAAWEMNQKKKKGQRFSPTRLINIAANADFHDMTARPVTVKKRGKGRGALDPSPTARVIQQMVSARLRLWMTRRLHPDQFKFQGGRPKACRALLKHMEGGSWATVLDVRDFYPSCDADALATTLARELHLRPAMVRAALSARAVALQPVARRGGRPARRPARQKRGFYLSNPKAARASKKAGGEGKGEYPPTEGPNPSGSPGGVTPSVGAHVPCRDGLRSESRSGNVAGGSQPRRQTKPAVCRRGLVLGSSSSDLAAEWIMSAVLKALPESTRVVCFADNIIVICRTRKGAREVKQTLTRALAQGPAGSLTFGTRRVVRLGDGFQFLGYDFRTVRGAPEARPTDENVKKVLGDFHQRMKRGQWDEARRCIERWLANFDLWPAADDWGDEMMTDVDGAAAGRWQPPGANDEG